MTAKGNAFLMKVYYKYTYKFCINVYDVLTLNNMSVVRNFDVISEQFNVVRMQTYTREKYAKKWFTK
jgi:hypothetical protein